MVPFSHEPIEASYTKNKSWNTVRIFCVRVFTIRILRYHALLGLLPRQSSRGWWSLVFFEAKTFSKDMRIVSPELLETLDRLQWKKHLRFIWIRHVIYFYYYLLGSQKARTLAKRLNLQAFFCSHGHNSKYFWTLATAREVWEKDSQSPILERGRLTWDS